MLYLCENCNDIHIQSTPIEDCYECASEICSSCYSLGRDGNHYCELCVEVADKLYDEESGIVEDNEEEDIF